MCSNDEISTVSGRQITYDRCLDIDGRLHGDEVSRTEAFVKEQIFGSSSLICALAIVLQRSIKAAPHRVHLAARHIEKIDPYGPFEVISPWRSRIQGIVTGCPRFTVERDETADISIGTPPTVKLNDPHLFVTEWAGYLRGIIRIDTSTDWYGSAQTRYHVLPDTAPAPQHAPAIYNHAGIIIYREQLQ